VAALTEDALATLRRMVEIPSVTGREADLVAYLADRMARLGYATRVDEVGNVVGEIGDPSGPTIMLVGHVDTVDGVVLVRETDSRLYGRGTVDAKGPLATMVHAGVRAAGAAPVRIVVVGAVDEEGTSRGARHLLRRSPPDALVIGEPSGVNGVVIGYKGMLSLDYDVRRPPHHTSAPEEQAVEVAVDVWQAIRDRLGGGPADGPAFDRVVPSLVGLRGGVDRARARVSCRLPPDFPAEEFLGWLSANARGGRVTVRECVPAVRTRRNDPVVRGLSAAVRRHAGTPAVKVKLGTSDMNVLAPHWRVPVAAYGPGDAHLDHSADEHIDLDHYLLAIEVLAAALPQIAGDLPRGRSGPEAADQGRVPWHSTGRAHSRC
jgi:LysW-gamma-L-lysine carboxypeptidase